MVPWDMRGEKKGVQENLPDASVFFFFLCHYKGNTVQIKLYVFLFLLSSDQSDM
jgi:hypothetical protein